MTGAAGISRAATSHTAADTFIETERLRLVPWAPAHLLALIDSVPHFERLSGMTIASGLRDHLVSDEVSPAWLAMLRASTQTDPWRHGYAVVHRGSNAIIGSAAFKGPPGDDGVVEIAYGVAPDHQGRGYATEAAEALVAFASRVDGIHVIRAHTAPTPNASTRVLTKCGFQQVGEIVDPEDGPVWRWERDPANVQRRDSNAVTGAIREPRCFES